MRERLLWLPVAAISSSAYATTYLSVEQAQQAIFPGARLTAAFFPLSAEQRQRIEAASGTRVPPGPVRAWRAPDGALFLLDDVIGKHEEISYALGLEPDGRVRQIEILSYRESRGGEIRGAAWRRQFAGKSAADPVRLDEDIRNISGATLSCRHLTDGVRRLLATHAIALR